MARKACMARMACMACIIGTARMPRMTGTARMARMTGTARMPRMTGMARMTRMVRRINMPVVPCGACTYCRYVVIAPRARTQQYTACRILQTCAHTWRRARASRACAPPYDRAMCRTRALANAICACGRCRARAVALRAPHAAWASSRRCAHCGERSTCTPTHRPLGPSCTSLRTPAHIGRMHTVHVGCTHTVPHVPVIAGGTYTHTVLAIRDDRSRSFTIAQVKNVAHVAQVSHVVHVAHVARRACAISRFLCTSRMSRTSRSSHISRT
jgi:hypothetical protein